MIVNVRYRDRHDDVLGVDHHRFLGDRGPSPGGEGDVVLGEERQGDLRPTPDPLERVAATVQRQQDPAAARPYRRRDRDGVHALVNGRQHGDRALWPLRQVHGYLSHAESVEALPSYVQDMFTLAVISIAYGTSTAD